MSALAERLRSFKNRMRGRRSPEVRAEAVRRRAEANARRLEHKRTTHSGGHGG